MHDDEQQQGRMARPLSPSAWVIFLAMALATAAVILLGHDAAGADPLSSAGNTTATVASAISPRDASPWLATSAGDDPWAGLLSSIGIVPPDGPMPVVVTPPAGDPAPPRADGGAPARYREQKQHGNHGGNRGSNHGDTGGRAGSRTDRSDRSDGTARGRWAPAGAALSTWDAGAADIPSSGDGPGPGLGVTVGVRTRSELRLVTTSGTGGTASTLGASAASSTSAAEPGHVPANDEPPAPMPAPPLPCSAPGAPALVNANPNGSTPGPVSALPPTCHPRFNLRRTTCPPAAVAHRAAADARATNGSRGPPVERTQ